MREAYSLVRAYVGEYPVDMMCRLLKVSRSGYYAWLARASDEGWESLKDEVERLWRGSDGRFGFRSVHAVMPEDGRPSRHKVRKAMRELGIRGCHPRARKRTTVPDPGAPERPDLVRRRFDWPVPTTALVGDITYLRTGEGWLYLASVIDLATRMVVGWSFSARMTADLVVGALEVARGRGYVAGGAIFHSDRGSQYTSRELARWAGANDVRLSVGRTGSCHDNAVAESFWGSLKNEMYHRATFATRDEARLACIEYIEGYYNRRRPHSSVGYRFPADLMAEFESRMENLFGKEEFLAA